MRAPIQVLVLPYLWEGDEPAYLILKVNDGDYWQFVAGGGEDGETPTEAARRECREETGLEGDLFQLDSQATIPKHHFRDSSSWGEEILVIPEYAFALKASKREIQLSREHKNFRWVAYQEGIQMLKWDSNRNALWELDQRLIALKGSQA